MKTSAVSQPSRKKQLEGCASDESVLAQSKLFGLRVGKYVFLMGPRRAFAFTPGDIGIVRRDDRYPSYWNKYNVIVAAVILHI